MKKLNLNELAPNNNMARLTALWQDKGNAGDSKELHVSLNVTCQETQAEHKLTLINGAFAFLDGAIPRITEPPIPYLVSTVKPRCEPFLLPHDTQPVDRYLQITVDAAPFISIARGDGPKDRHWDNFQPYVRTGTMFIFTKEVGPILAVYHNMSVISHFFKQAYLLEKPVERRVKVCHGRLESEVTAFRYTRETRFKPTKTERVQRPTRPPVIR